MNNLGSDVPSGFAPSQFSNFENEEWSFLENLFLARNPHAALVLGHARGSALLAAVHHKRVVAEYSALEIKRAVVGTGRAAKEQVQHMVKMLLGLARNPPADAADALACAICHIHTRQMAARVSSREQVG